MLYHLHEFQRSLLSPECSLELFASGKMNVASFFGTNKRSNGPRRAEQPQLPGNLMWEKSRVAWDGCDSDPMRSHQELSGFPRIRTPRPFPQVISTEERALGTKPRLPYHKAAGF